MKSVSGKEPFYYHLPRDNSHPSFYTLLSRHHRLLHSRLCQYSHTHPATMTHASIPRAERIKNGLTDSLIRLSVGVEDIDDLIDDLNMALGQLSS